MPELRPCMDRSIRSSGVMNRRTTVLWWGAAIVIAAGLAVRYGSNSCGPFPEWQTSPYVLPYPAGSAYYVSQANCSSGGHRGPYKFSYDFVMPVGTTVTAARAGVVSEIRAHFRDGQAGEAESNWVKV